MAMKKHKEATAQEQSCAVASFLFFRVERTDQNEDSADHIDCRDRSRARRPLGSSGSALVGEGGFEPPKSLTADLQSVPFGHSGIPPYSLCCTHFETQRSGFKMKRRKAIADMELFASAESGMEQASFDGGAGRRIRTPDLLITKSRKILKISFSGRF